MGAGAILVAAGLGRRLGEAGGGPKALIELEGRTLVTHALTRVAAAVDGPVVVVHTPGYETEFAAAAKDAGVEVTLAAGGETRSESVRSGLAALPPDVDVVAIHDAARALVPPSLVRATIDAIGGKVVAAAPGMAMPDSLKLVDERRRVRRHVDRAGIWAVQTPQTFARVALEAAHRWASGRSATDDLLIIEAAVEAGALEGEIVLVPSSPWAVKVTYAQDLAFAAALLRSGEAPA